MTETKKIWCCACNADVDARLTDGKEIYAHRADLAGLPFWKCDVCQCYVGCHHKTKDRTRPLGNIPTAEIRNARRHIHQILDPLWVEDRNKRREIYGKISALIGREYHTSEIKSVEEAREIYRIILNMKGEKQHEDI